MRLVHTKGVEPYETTIALIRALRAAGIKTALVTASKNGAEILKVTKTAQLFDATVTGVDAQNLHLKGKPAPDVFLEAAKRLSVTPERAIVVEDAEAGVASGRAGHFGMVIGVARQDNLQSLREHGADVAVRDLAEVQVPGHSGLYPAGMAMTDLDVTDANWILVYDKYDKEHEGQRESLCALGNGKFCTRGAAAESRADDIHYPGNYVAGGYNCLRFEIGEPVLEIEELVNMPNWLYQTFKIEDSEWFSLDAVEILEFSQKLNLHEGLLYRQVRIRDKDGRESELRERRFVHMRYSHLAGIETSITALNWSGRLTFCSGIDASVVNSGETTDPRFKSNKHLKTIEKAADADGLYLKVITTDSKLVVAQAARLSLIQNGTTLRVDAKNIVEDEFVAQELELQVTQSQTVQLQKTVSLYTSRDRGIYEPGTASRELVGDAPNFDSLIECQLEAWKSLWKQFDLFIETTEEYSKLVPSLLLHLNSFQMQCKLPLRIPWTSTPAFPLGDGPAKGTKEHIFGTICSSFLSSICECPMSPARFSNTVIAVCGKLEKLLNPMVPWEPVSPGRVQAMEESRHSTIGGSPTIRSGFATTRT